MAGKSANRQAADATLLIIMRWACSWALAVRQPLYWSNGYVVPAIRDRKVCSVSASIAHPAVNNTRETTGDKFRRREADETAETPRRSSLPITTTCLYAVPGVRSARELERSVKRNAAPATA